MSGAHIVKLQKGEEGDSCRYGLAVGYAHRGVSLGIDALGLHRGDKVRSTFLTCIKKKSRPRSLCVRLLNVLLLQERNKVISRI